MISMKGMDDKNRKSTPESQYLRRCAHKKQAQQKSVTVT